MTDRISAVEHARRRRKVPEEIARAPGVRQLSLSTTAARNPDGEQRPTAVSVKWICRDLGVSAGLIKREIESERLPALHIGGRTLIELSDYATWKLRSKTATRTHRRGGAKVRRPKRTGE
jgi:hypothetical protein